MEPANMQPTFNKIIPLENISSRVAKQNQLVEENNLLKEEVEAVSFLYQTSVQQNNELQKMLGKSGKVDEKLGDEVQGSIKALEEKNDLLQMEITYLKNQKQEILNASEENSKSFYERYIVLEKENRRLKLMATIHEKSIDAFEVAALDENIQPGGIAGLRWLRITGNIPLRTRLKNQIEETRKLQIELLQSTFLEDELINENKIKNI